MELLPGTLQSFMLLLLLADRFCESSGRPFNEISALALHLGSWASGVPGNTQ